MKKKIKSIIILVLFLVCFADAISQTISKNKQNPNTFILKGDFSKNFIGRDQIKTELCKHFNLPEDYEFKTYNIQKNRNPVKERKDKLGLTHERLLQYYKGIKVDDSDIRVQYKNDSVVSVNGVYTKETGINITPILDKETAIKKALEFVNARKYKWLLNYTSDDTATFYPDPELVICKNRFNPEDTIFHLAYKMDIYAIEPLSRNYIYVDATNGAIINKRSILNTYGENAATRYSGSKNINTKLQPTGKHILFDDTRGNGITTENLQRTTNTANSIPFEDLDNNWTSLEYNNLNKDNAALDAHWGIEMTYDYFHTIHDRDSYDDQGHRITCYVHYGYGVDNAYWDGDNIYFGDGSFVQGSWPPGDCDPLTSLDIVAHEYAHAICQYTADLAYDGESGAINEGLSDIWSECVKNYAAPEKNIWEIGDEIIKNGYSFIRSKSDPKSNSTEYPQPNTYGGTNWVNTYGCVSYLEFDNCGVHINSGVMNYWFYLLVNGGTGTNDLSHVYNVRGIGIDKAAELVYLTEPTLTWNCGFSYARDLFIAKAEEKYGTNSPEVISVTNAWYAVGVGSEYQCGSGNWFVVYGETYNVDTTIPVCNIRLSNVTVTNGAKLILNVDRETEINGPFEVELQSELEIN